MDRSFELHRQRRALFTTDAGGCEDGRPGYPASVFELLRTECGLAPGWRTLEIGPGTGQATGDLLDTGAHVTAVELGPELAERLRAKYEGHAIEVVSGAFEDVQLPAASFDLVVAATSFHWVPPGVGLERAGAALRPGGSLALWWNFFGDPDRPDPFHEAIQPLLQRHAPELIDIARAGSPGTGGHPYALDTEARIGEIDAAGLFGPVGHDVISWTGAHSPSQIRTMFGSFSPWLALDPSVREPLLDELKQLAATDFGGTVERPYLTPVYWASRR